MKKRLLACVLCITMLLGLIQTMAFAVTTLTNIGITGIDAPVAGKTPDYTAGCNSSVYLDSGNNSSNYYRNGIMWYDLTNDFNVATSANFIAGHQYKVVVFINVSEGFMFANDVAITINNLPCTSTERYSEDLIVAELVFDTIPEQTPASLLEYYTDHSLAAGNPLETVTLVRINNNPDFFGIIDNWDGEWYYNDEKTDNIDDYEKVSGSVYAANTAYAYVITATLKNNNVFTNETQLYFSVRNKSYTVTPSTVSADKKTATFYIFLDKLEVQPISSVSYTLNGYTTGSPINAITIDSASPVITDGVYGTDYFITIANRIPIMTGNFANDTTYTLYIAVKSNSHNVSTLTKNDIKLNGKTATNIEVVGGVLYAIYYLPQLTAPKVEIEHIMLRLDSIPTANGELVYPVIHAVNGDENLASAIKTPVIDEGYGWYEGDYFILDGYYEYIEAPEKFKNGKAYTFFASLEANSGYVMADGCYIQLALPNGLLEGELCDRGSAYVTYEFYFNFGAPETKPKATNVKVNVTGYEAGKNIADLMVTNVINGQEIPYATDGDNPGYGMFYAILNEEGQITTDIVFEYDKEYKLSVLILGEFFDLSELEAKNITCGNVTAIEDEFMKFKKFADARFTLPVLKKQLPNPFTDVKQGKFYYDSVLWAVENNITAGITPTTFKPNDTCTRAQVVSFLWRAAGSPEPKTTTNPFTDVKQKAYYYKAVLWAVENNITAGVTPTTFAPNDDCTRGQIVAFLWRSQNSPKVESANPFTDVKQTAYYFDAVLWAVKNDVTAGTSPTTFEPTSPCTRGQIVSFLYRALNK